MTGMEITFCLCGLILLVGIGLAFIAAIAAIRNTDDDNTLGTSAVIGIVAIIACVAGACSCHHIAEKNKDLFVRPSVIKATTQPAPMLAEKT